MALRGQPGTVPAMIEAWQDIPPRLATVSGFPPWPKNGSSSGTSNVHVDADISNLPAGEAGLAIERLLSSALDDPERCLGMEGNFNEVAYKDPRVCDLAALLLSRRWSEKYPFQWTANAKECDAQISRLRARWRSEKGLRLRAK